MGYGVVIKRKDGKPLGQVQEVITKLSEAFPNSSFALTAFGTWNGAFQGDGFGIEFYLGSDPVVKHIRAFLYGEFAKAQHNFSQLPDWQVS